MNNFDEYKKIWKDREPVSIKNISFNNQHPEIIEKLKKFQKKQYRKNIAKTAFIILDLTFIVLILNSRLSSPLIKLGLAIIFAGITIFMIFYWKTQFNLSTLNLHNTSTEFLKIAINNLKYQKQFLKTFLPWLGLIAIIGLNILYSGISGLTFVQQLVLHIGMSVLLILAVFFGLKRKLKYFKKVYQPLIDELNGILQTINE